MAPEQRKLGQVRSFMILNLDLGQEVKESARPNFRHLSRPWFGVSNLFLPRIIEEKPLGGLARPPLPLGKGRVK